LKIGNLEKTWSYDDTLIILEEYDWTFRVKDSFGNYSWPFELTVVDVAGHETTMAQDIYTIFQPGWPSGIMDDPECDERYRIFPTESGGPVSEFIYGSRNQTSCSVVINESYTSKIYDSFSGDGGLATWDLFFDDVFLSENINHFNIFYIVGSTRCEGNCTGTNWRVGFRGRDFFNEFDYVTPGWQMEGSSEWMIQKRDNFWCICKFNKRWKVRIVKHTNGLNLSDHIASQ